MGSARRLGPSPHLTQTRRPTRDQSAGAFTKLTSLRGSKPTQVRSDLARRRLAVHDTAGHMVILACAGIAACVLSFAVAPDRQAATTSADETAVVVTLPQRPSEPAAKAPTPRQLPGSPTVFRRPWLGLGGAPAAKRAQARGLLRRRGERHLDHLVTPRHEELHRPRQRQAADRSAGSHPAGSGARSSGTGLRRIAAGRQAAGRGHQVSAVDKSTEWRCAGCRGTCAKADLSTDRSSQANHASKGRSETAGIEGRSAVPAGLRCRRRFPRASAARDWSRWAGTFARRL